MDSYRIEWATSVGALVVVEPSPDELAAHAAALAEAYNHPRNAPLLGNTQDLTPAEVLEHYAAMRERGDRPFVFLHEGVLAGDGDLRGIEGAVAEFAFLIAAPSAQGQGLGTRFATMLHVFAFDVLGLDRVYASIIPANVASRRVFDKLGYRLDTSSAGRARAEEPDDIVMSIGAHEFRARSETAIADIRIAVR